MRPTVGIRRTGSGLVAEDDDSAPRAASANRWREATAAGRERVFRAYIGTVSEKTSVVGGLYLGAGGLIGEWINYKSVEFGGG